MIVVTGGHGGIGLETTRVLSKAGATIVVGARDPAKAKDAFSGLRRIETLPLDLADPGSIDCFADELVAAHPRLDVLINNAGIMATPLMRDARGYELQFATNHLGHFQFTQRLWNALTATGDAQVVTLTSAGHRFAGVDLDDWNFEQRPTTSGKPTGNRRAPTHSSPSSSTGAEGARASAPSRFIPAASLRPT